MCLFFFFNDTATTEIYTLSLHDALPILCEVVNHKRSLAMNVPVVVGFSILQLAKLRMLQFYYDCNILSLAS